MAVIIASKQRFKDTVTPSDLGVETDIVSLPEMSDDYEVEGYIDLSQMQDGDEVIIREYIAVDGIDRKVYTYVTLVNQQSEPVLRIPRKIIPYDGQYRVTITQSKGVVRQYPYAFVVLVYGAT